MAQPLGPGGVSASFAGDKYYLPSSAQATTLLFAFPHCGAFTLGDKSDALGAGATFWDAQWSVENSLSGGVAPATFRGSLPDAGSSRAEPTPPGRISRDAPVARRSAEADRPFADEAAALRA